jgi:hypothetical protein
LANALVYFNPSFLAQNVAVGIPISLAMSKKDISSTEFFRCMNQIKADSIPVMVFFSSSDGIGSKLYGFLDSVTNDLGLVFSTEKGTPSVCSTIVVPILRDCRFFREIAADLPETEREDFSFKYGDTVLSMVLPSGSRLMVFFTSNGKL